MSWWPFRRKPKLPAPATSRGPETDYAGYFFAQGTEDITYLSIERQEKIVSVCIVLKSEYVAIEHFEQAKEFLGPGKRWILAVANAIPDEDTAKFQRGKK